MIFFMINVNVCQKQHIDNALLMHALRTSFFIHPLMQLLNDPLSIWTLFTSSETLHAKELMSLDKTC